MRMRTVLIGAVIPAVLLFGAMVAVYHLEGHEEPRTITLAGQGNVTGEALAVSRPRASQAMEPRTAGEAPEDRPACFTADDIENLKARMKQGGVDFTELMDTIQGKLREAPDGKLSEEELLGALPPEYVDEFLMVVQRMYHEQRNFSPKENGL